MTAGSARVKRILLDRTAPAALGRRVEIRQKDRLPPAGCGPGSRSDLLLPASEGDAGRDDRAEHEHPESCGCQKQPLRFHAPMPAARSPAPVTAPARQHSAGLPSTRTIGTRSTPAAFRVPRAGKRLQAPAPPSPERGAGRSGRSPDPLTSAPGEASRPGSGAARPALLHPFSRAPERCG